MESENSFVGRRLSPGFRTTLSWEELAERTADYMDDGHWTQGYRDGVRLVQFPALDFFSGVVEIDSTTELVATFEARREGESKHIVVVAKGGEKLEAKHVDIVVYHRDVLLKDGGEEVGDYEWEIVSINARPTLQEEPMNPVAMARNMLAMVGGTQAEYTAYEFARAVIYWSQHAMRG